MAGRAEGLNDIFDHDITVKGFTIGKCQTPTSPLQLANKKYVDDEIGNIFINIDGGNSVGNFGGVSLSPLDGGTA